MKRFLHRYLSTPGFVPCYFLLGLITLFSSCKKDFYIDLKDNEPKLVVEAYINNLMPEYNYVILTKSMDYYEPRFEGLAVSNATVTITEGDPGRDGSIQWNTSTRVVLEESQNARVPAQYRKGVYIDQKTVATLSVTPNGLIARPGKYYKLEIGCEGKNYSAITSLPQLVQIDSLSSGFPYIDEEDGGILKSRITVNYKDPDTIGNRQLFYWRHDRNRDGFGWGALSNNRRSTGIDDLINGQYVKIAQPYGFVKGDKVDYYLVSVTRQVYSFWDSFNKARNNDGPFSTPVELISNIQGPNVTGCFSGFSVTTKSIKM